MCKFGGDPATSVVEVAICAKKFTDRQTDGRRTPSSRDCNSSWNELKIRLLARTTHVIFLVYKKMLDCTNKKRYLVLAKAKLFLKLISVCV